MKFKNLVINSKHTAIALIFAACQSDQDKLAQFEAVFGRVNTEIKNISGDNQTADSVARNLKLKLRNENVIRHTPQVDSICDEYMAVKYPGTKVLSRDIIKMLRTHMRNAANQH